MVSIIVPVYKSKDTLKRCVESLLAQTVEDTEMILVDDGSPDGSGELCDKLAEEDSRIQVIHKENGGVSSARNVGIEAAKGDYLLFAGQQTIMWNRIWWRSFWVASEMTISPSAAFIITIRAGTSVRIPEVPDKAARKIFWRSTAKDF